MRRDGSPAAPAIAIVISFEDVRPRVLAAYGEGDVERVVVWLETHPELRALVDDALRLEDEERAA